MALASPGRVGGLWVLSHSYLHDLDEFQKQPLPVLGLLLQHDDGTYPARKARQGSVPREGRYVRPLCQWLHVLHT